MAEAEPTASLFLSPPVVLGMGKEEREEESEGEGPRAAPPAAAGDLEVTLPGIAFSPRTRARSLAVPGRDLAAPARDLATFSEEDSDESDGSVAFSPAASSLSRSSSDFARAFTRRDSRPVSVEGAPAAEEAELVIVDLDTGAKLSAQQVEQIYQVRSCCAPICTPVHPCTPPGTGATLSAKQVEQIYQVRSCCAPISTPVHPCTSPWHGGKALGTAGGADLSGAKLSAQQVEQTYQARDLDSGAVHSLLTLSSSPGGVA
ncbi:hypothetical protein T492DRAFT_900482, partial [Pavlovales sp. CCMP2436]